MSQPRSFQLRLCFEVVCGVPSDECFTQHGGHGCIEVEETPYGLVPRRFTKAQLAHWDQIGMVRAARAHGIAGTTMRFVTNQAQLSFSYRVLSICGEKMTRG